MCVMCCCGVCVCVCDENLCPTGFITFLSNTVAGALSSMALGWQQVFVLLHACYFFIHYLFASQTAQVAALSTAFMAWVSIHTPQIKAAFTLVCFILHHQYKSTRFPRWSCLKLRENA